MTAPDPQARVVEVTADVIALIWREHSNCNWVSTGVNVMWSCGIWHPGPIYMQPTTRDRHVAALVMTQIEAYRAALLAEGDLPAVEAETRDHESRVTADIHELLSEWRQTCSQMGLRWTDGDAAAFVAAALAHRVRPVS